MTFPLLLTSDIEDYNKIIGEAIEREKARYQLRMTEAGKAECQKAGDSSVADGAAFR